MSQTKTPPWDGYKHTPLTKCIETEYHDGDRETAKRAWAELLALKAVAYTVLDVVMKPRDRDTVRTQAARLKQSEEELRNWQQYASYLHCCAKCGVDDVHDFKDFAARNLPQSGEAPVYTPEQDTFNTPEVTPDVFS